jgi:hypothetical protein
MSFQRARVTDQVPVILYSAKTCRTVPHVLSGLLFEWTAVCMRIYRAEIIIIIIIVIIIISLLVGTVVVVAVVVVVVVVVVV